MILPTKHVPISRSVMGQSVRVLGRLQRPITMSRLWDDVRHETDFRSFDRFVIVLDFLFMLGLIELRDGLLRRVRT